MTNSSISKEALRREMLKKRKNLSAEFLQQAELSFAEQIKSLNCYRYAKTVMLYMSFQNEAPTDLLTKQAWMDGKNVVLPYTDKEFKVWAYKVTGPEQLLLSPLGIREPDPAVCALAAPSSIDLIIVPGVAFDPAGNRIGFGKGCYDRFLPLLRTDAPKIALAYDMQIVEALPFQEHDIPLDGILTQSGIKQVTEKLL